MLVRAIAKFEFATEELSPALAKAKALLATATAAESSPGLEVWVGATKSSSILRELAYAVDGATTGFTDPTGTLSWTASQVRAGAADLCTAYRGAPNLPRDVVFDLVGELADAHRDEIRTFSVCATTVRWRGAPATGTGQLRVDLLRKTKSRSGARLPVITALLTFEASGARDPNVATTLATVKRTAGARFKVDSFLPANDDALTDAQTAALDAGVANAVARARGAIVRTGESLGALPHLYANSSAAARERISAVLDKRQESVSFDRALRRMMKTHFADFQARTWIEATVFTRPLTERIDLAVVVDKVHNWGLGKSFQVSIGLVDAQLMSRTARPFATYDVMSLFRVQSADSQPGTWAYSTGDELEGALEGVARVLGAALPALEPKLRSAVAEALIDA